MPPARKRFAAAIAACAAFVVLAWTSGELQTPFITQPYLQLGSRFADGSVSVVWHAARQSPAAVVEWRSADADPWRTASVVDRLDMPDRTVFEAAIAVGRTGRGFEYRVRAGANDVFTGRGTAPPPVGAGFAFAVMGDGGDGGAEQRALAEQLQAQRAAANVQLVILAGDLAYDCGKRDEYATHFFPVYNANPGSPGAPLMRNVVFAGAVGNHDVGDKGYFLFGRCTPDYSYFAFWKHPAGFAGPLPINEKHRPLTPASDSVYRGADLPRTLARANFSFDWGAAHFVVLDSNRYVDWSNPALTSWLNRDLEQARAARWRFVVFHHPPFNLSHTHAEQQWMRALVPVFERHRVAVVFAGHVHNFQWFGPATFIPDPEQRQKFDRGQRGDFAGTIQLQQDYDGEGMTRATAPVYVVSGAGGHNLKEQDMRCPGDLQPRPADCTARAVVNGAQPSATIVSVLGDALRIRQVGADGKSILSRTVSQR
jgi:predicted phosphodiesterase